MTELADTQIEFTIEGSVSSKSFLSWIVAHGAKIGVRVTKLEHQSAGLLVGAEGVPEMLEALTVACLLGPSDVLVEDVQIMR